MVVCRLHCSVATTDDEADWLLALVAKSTLHAPYVRRATTEYPRASSVHRKLDDVEVVGVTTNQEPLLGTVPAITGIVLVARRVKSDHPPASVDDSFALPKEGIVVWGSPGFRNAQQVSRRKGAC